jgi:hypothetical protein
MKNFEQKGAGIMTDGNTKKAHLEPEYNPVKFWFWVGLCLVFTVGLVWSIYDDVAGTPVSQSPPVFPAAIVKPVEARHEPASIDIRKIVPGIRVRAFNPEVSDEERAVWEQVDYTRWLTLDILLMDEKNEPIYLTLIRPVEWVIAMDAQEGKQIWLELEELNGRGWGRVMGLSGCRKVLPGEGRVVTGIFSHRVQGLINVHVEGLKEPIGVTKNHPFWSEDRKDFVEAGSLQVGERLRAMVGGPDGGIARVTSVAPRGPPGSSEIVYNMEVEGEHAYQVTGLWIVVHNTYSLERGMSIANKVRAGVSRIPRHHIFPQEFKTWFLRRGVDINRYTIEVTQGIHSAIHTWIGPGGGWNQVIMKRLVEAETKAGRQLTQREILQIGAQLRREVGLQGHKVIQY